MNLALDVNEWSASCSRETAGIALWYSAGLRAGWSGIRVPPGAENFSLHHHVSTGSGVHLASYQNGNKIWIAFYGQQSWNPKPMFNESVIRCTQTKQHWFRDMWCVGTSVSNRHVLQQQCFTSCPYGNSFLVRWYTNSPLMPCLCLSGLRVSSSLNRKRGIHVPHSPDLTSGFFLLGVFKRHYSSWKSAKCKWVVAELSWLQSRFKMKCLPISCFLMERKGSLFCSHKPCQKISCFLNACQYLAKNRISSWCVSCH
jgi:hypothetical protein